MTTRQHQVSFDDDADEVEVEGHDEGRPGTAVPFGGGIQDAPIFPATVYKHLGGSQGLHTGSAPKGPSTRVVITMIRNRQVIVSSLRPNI